MVSKAVDVDFLEELLRFLEIPGVDVHRHHFEILATQFLLQLVERGHFEPARHAPGRPEIEEDRPATERIERDRLAFRVLEMERDHWLRGLWHLKCRHLALRQRLQCRELRARGLALSAGATDPAAEKVAEPAKRI